MKKKIMNSKITILIYQQVGTGIHCNQLNIAPPLEVSVGFGTLLH
jgi:hypothetical protein